MKVGDKISYKPVIMTEDEPAEGVIKMYEPRGFMFKMDMLAIDEVGHWIPSHECVVLEEGVVDDKKGRSDNS